MSNSFIFIILFIILFWLVTLSFVVYRFIAHYRRLIQGTDKSNLESILDLILNNLKIHNNDIEKLKNGLIKVEGEISFHIQKVGIIRYNPFSDTGGDQSFVLAILDGKDNGVVLTSLHGRGVTRWYAKNVKEGQGTDYKLSGEEEKAIKGAVLLRNKKV